MNSTGMGFSNRLTHKVARHVMSWVGGPWYVRCATATMCHRHHVPPKPRNIEPVEKQTETTNKH